VYQVDAAIANCLEGFERCRSNLHLCRVMIGSGRVTVAVNILRKAGVCSMKLI
jgi:hypothetical protein